MIVTFVALALSGLGDAEYCRGHVVSALVYFEECIVLAREHGMGKIIAANLSMKALILAWQNEYAQSLEVHHEAFELAVKTHNLRAEMINLISGGYIWLYSGNLDKAEASIERCITLARCTYVIARDRVLAAHGRGQRDSQTIEELRRICQCGKEVGLILSLPALETALAEA
jgi:hypothetical protein